MFQRKFLFISFIVSLFAASFAQAQAISVNPKRIVFDGRDRVQEVYLLNSGDEETVYRVSFEETRMNDKGSVEVIKEETPQGYKSVEGMVRYSPRQVTIPPRGSQVVRLMMRKKKDTPNGEYRSNIVFRNVPKQESKSLDNVLAKEGQVGVKIIPIFGISIPVIVRQGELAAQAAISDLKLNKEDDGSYIADLTLNRTGNRSLYGHFKADYTSPDGSQITQVGVIKGIAAYDGIKSRPVSIKLQVPEGTNINKGGKLTVYFEEDRDMGGDASAEQSLTVM